MALVGAIAFVVLAAGAGLGWLGAQWSEAARVTELRQTVEALERERRQMLALAARLDSVEADYRRLRRVMTGDVAPSERDVRLPPAPPEQRAEAGAGGSPSADRERLSWPLAQRGFVTRRHREGDGVGDGHPGIDIAVPTGSYVRAARGGVVDAAGDDPLYGRYVRLRHPGGLTSLYGHNRWLFVREGDSVDRAEVIALSGSSGRSTAPHLHFELNRDGETLDPADYLSEDVSASRFAEGTER